MISLTTNSVRRGIPPEVPGSVRIEDGPGTILLTSRFSGGRSVNYLGYSWISPGGEGLTHFVSSGTNHARKEPDRSRDSPVTLLHCSIRTRRIRTALATRRAQRGHRRRAGGYARHACWPRSSCLMVVPRDGGGPGDQMVYCCSGHRRRIGRRRRDCRDPVAAGPGHRGDSGGQRGAWPGSWPDRCRGGGVASGGSGRVGLLGCLTCRASEPGA